jgi:DNA-binding response OmpR family regulator
MTSKILVVDDSITIQKIVAMAFEKEDAVVEGIGNGSDALVKLEKFKPDIVLADVNMPGLNGFELSKKIKEPGEFDSVSVLLLTSDFEDFDEDLFLDSLADDHITKPFKSEDIVRRVMELLNENGDSDTVEDDGNVITLTPSDRMEEESVVELGKDQLIDPPEEISLEEDEVQLELSDEDMPVTLENPENEELVVGLEEDNTDHSIAEDEPAEEPVNVADSPCADSQELVEAPSAKQVPEESLDELVRRVTELTRKSEAIREQCSAEEMQPLETLDEMIREVNALKNNPVTVGDGGNGNGKISSPLDTTDVNTMIAELNYFSEENAEELEAAFNEILREHKNISHPSTPDTADELAAADEGNEDKEIESDTFHEDLLISSLGISPANSVEAPEIETLPEASEVEASLEENDVEVDEESFENISALQSSQEDLYARLMGKEFREVLEQSLTASMEKEISGISDKIIKSVEEAVKAIIPGLVRDMVAKEIELHKNENSR